MDAPGPEVGVRSGVPADAVAQSLELALADLGESLALGAGRRPGVEIDGDLELGGDTLAQHPGKRDAVVHYHVAHRDEGHDVGRTQAGMLTRARGEALPLSHLTPRTD